MLDLCSFSSLSCFCMWISLVRCSIQYNIPGDARHAIAHAQRSHLTDERFGRFAAPLHRGPPLGTQSRTQTPRGTVSCKNKRTRHPARTPAGLEVCKRWRFSVKCSRQRWWGVVVISRGLHGSSQGCHENQSSRVTERPLLLVIADTRRRRWRRWAMDPRGKIYTR